MDDLSDDLPKAVCIAEYSLPWFSFFSSHFFKIATVCCTSDVI